jgi:hypothetical protein
MEKKPDPALNAKTVQAELGMVDAFVSHSWSDDGGDKYDGLHAWARERHNKDEDKQARASCAARVRSCEDADLLIWLDKACINQANIEDALSGLPVFLVGCKQLLVLAGQTYPSRLWWYDVRRSNAGCVAAPSEPPGVRLTDRPA